MGTLAFYLLGALLKIFTVLFSIPVFALDFLLDVPGLTIVWGVFLWGASLLGTAGDTLVTLVRGCLAIGLVYLPFYIVRKFRLRTQPILGGDSASTPVK